MIYAWLILPIALALLIGLSPRGYKRDWVYHATGLIGLVLVGAVLVWSLGFGPELIEYGSHIMDQLAQ